MKKVNITDIANKIQFIYGDECEKNTVGIVIFSDGTEYFFDEKFNDKMSNDEVQELLLRGAVVFKDGKYYKPASFDNKNVSFGGGQIDLTSYVKKTDLISYARKIDLTSYAKKTDLPTKVSQLENDSNFIRQIDLTSYAKKTDLPSYAKKTDIPTKVSQLENDSNFISSIPEVKSLILTSPNGSKFKITISDDGQLITTPSSYTNYIYNEDTFTNPTGSIVPFASTYYYTSNNTLREVPETGVLKISNRHEGTNGSLLVRHGKGDGNVYYIQFKIKSETGIIAGSSQSAILDTREPVPEWTTISYIYTDTSAGQYAIKLEINNNGAIPGVAYLKEPMRINLTEIYGAGNEPSDKALCDVIFSTFVPGLRG